MVLPSLEGRRVKDKGNRAKQRRRSVLGRRGAAGYVRLDFDLLEDRIAPAGTNLVVDEPNDSIFQAVDLGQDLFHARSNLAVDTSVDADYYAFQAPADSLGNLTAVMSIGPATPNLDGQVTLLDQNGGQLATTNVNVVDGVSKTVTLTFNALVRRR